MVGLPARGKSYITKKIKRYLAWQQHNVRIFNVGNRRRIAAGKPLTSSHVPGHDHSNPSSQSSENAKATEAAHILLNGSVPPPAITIDQSATTDPSNGAEHIEQSAEFFDPSNTEASQVREQLALSTLDELLDYLICGGGAIGILDATNSTLARRKKIFDEIKARDPKLGIARGRKVEATAAPSSPDRFREMLGFYRRTNVLLEVFPRYRVKGIQAIWSSCSHCLFQVIWSSSNCCPI